MIRKKHRLISYAWQHEFQVWARVYGCANDGRDYYLDDAMMKNSINDVNLC